MRGNVQRDVCPPLYYTRQTVVAMCENVRYHGDRGRLGAGLNDTINLSDPKTPNFEQESVI